jgi:hypothetical protein
MSQRMARKISDSHLADATRAGWADLSEALDVAAQRSQRLADEARDLMHDLQGEGRKRMKSARKETKWRAQATRNALTGRRQRRAPWLAGATALGLGIGASASYLVRRAWTARVRQQAIEKGLELDAMAAQQAQPGGVGSTPTVVSSPERVLRNANGTPTARP